MAEWCDERVGPAARQRFLNGVVSFDFSAGTILSKFNNTGLDMEKLESHTLKEAAWRSRLQRHAQSGKTIAASAGMNW